jgi:hypothetical protein
MRWSLSHLNPMAELSWKSFLLQEFEGRKEKTFVDILTTRQSKKITINQSFHRTIIIHSFLK